MIELDSVPTVLLVPQNNQQGNKLLVGFSDGRVTLFRINPMLTDSKKNSEFHNEHNRVLNFFLSTSTPYPSSSSFLFLLVPWKIAVKQELLIDSKDNTSAVTCLDTFDIYHDGKDELLVGRRDGTVQVFTMILENNDFQMDCQQLYGENFNESISCVFGGCIGAAGYSEIIVCTYTGKVFGLTTRTIADTLTGSSQEIFTDATQRITKLK